jgi:hypothetical protein
VKQQLILYTAGNDIEMKGLLPGLKGKGTGGNVTTAILKEKGVKNGQ